MPPGQSSAVNSVFRSQSPIIGLALIIYISFCLTPPYSLALKCPCNVGPCPSLGADSSVLDTCSRNYSHTYCVRTLNVTINQTSNTTSIIDDKDQPITIVDQPRIRDIYRCANYSTAKHDTELSIHIPMDLSTQSITIEYRCRNQDYCSLEDLIDDDCDAKSTLITDPIELSNLFPDIRPSNNRKSLRSCICVEQSARRVGKVGEDLSRHCRWTNDVRKDSGRNLPYCRQNPHGSLLYNRSDLRASIFCRGVEKPKQGESIFEDESSGGSKMEGDWRRFRCGFFCNFDDRCNHEREFEKIYCAAIRRLTKVSRGKSMKFVNPSIDIEMLRKNGVPSSIDRDQQKPIDRDQHPKPIDSRPPDESIDQDDQFTDQPTRATTSLESDHPIDPIDPDHSSITTGSSMNVINDQSSTMDHLPNDHDKPHSDSDQGGGAEIHGAGFDSKISPNKETKETKDGNGARGGFETMKGTFYLISLAICVKFMLGV